MDTLSYLRGRRLWVVRDFTVWGITDEVRLHYLAVERIENTDRVIFGATGIGETAQDVLFTDLLDFRGSVLPEKIAEPKVVVSPRSQYTAFVVGSESQQGFRIARTSDASGPVQVDLFIYEMGIPDD